MKQIGKYQILRELGSGGMGAVYEALDPVIERKVAIKVILEEALSLPEIKKRFYREARSAGKLAHNNIAIVHDVAEDNGTPYIVMEYLGGRDLSKLIEEKEPLTITQIMNYSRQVCLGLEYAHSKNIIHRDIKPSNIRILDNGTVKIIDFGLAKLERATSTQATGSWATMTGYMVGTPWYMSPEQIQRETVDKRTDIFSFGVVLYEMVTHQKPFDGDYTTAQYKIVHKSPREIVSRDITVKEIEGLILKCLEKSPDDRYSNFSEIIRQLDSISAHTRQVRSAHESENNSGHNDGELVKNLLREAKKYLRAQNTPKAVAAFKRVIEIDATNKTALTGLARIEKRIAAKATVISNSSSFQDRQGNRRIPGILLVLALLVLGVVVLLKLNSNVADTQVLEKRTAGPSPAGTPSGNDTLAKQPVGPTEKEPPRSSPANPTSPTPAPKLSKPKQADKFGRLQFTSEPSGATLWLAGERIGVTPFNSGKIRTGSYTVKFSKESYRPVTRNVQVQEGKTLNLYEKLVGLGRLVVRSQPDEAGVYVENRFKGNTPLEIDDLEEGAYNLAIRKPHYKETIQQVEVQAGKTKLVEAPLAQETGRITIQAIPWGSIYVDGELRKKDSAVQYSGIVASGVHSVRVVHSVLGRWEKKINVLTDQQRNIVVDFNKTYELVVASEPLAAEILVDGKSTGKYSPHLLRLVTGLHRIEVRKGEAVSEPKTVLVDRDFTEPLFFELTQNY